ncbi:MAG TPA: nucleoside triphosphate pyrophosphohydrolase [Oligoflexia bacterium]|nr:nucleoside triphosphate pyrophosphohydrolase [Oligoflexia bacterium]
MKNKDFEASFTRFAAIIKTLRTPGTGCPWDLEQDHLSLRPYLLEEAHEVLEAIDTKNDAALCDELGDLLLQVVLHAQVASDRGVFDLNDVLRGICEKMIRRHPHVFAQIKVDNSAQVLKNWEQIKLDEPPKGQEAPAQTSAHPAADRLASIPLSLPALLRAQRVGEKAARVHFDWTSRTGVLEKVYEELSELEAAINNASASLGTEQDPSRPWPPLALAQRSELEHELGDLLFSLCQLGRWLGINAEDSLRTCTERFIIRFREMEKQSGGNLAPLSEDELEEAWQKAKAALK